MKFTNLSQSFWGSALAALLAMIILMVSYFALEPTIGHSQASDTFLVTQVVSGAIAFAQNANDVSMVGTLNGLTGGTSYGTTTVRVTTNNASGYNMTIEFSSTTAMRRGPGEEAIGTAEIYNYLYSTGTASYPSGYSTTPANAQFGFSATASNTADVSDVFTNTGGLCGTGNNGGFTAGTCWRGASSTDETAATELISTSAPTPSSGSTSSVLFRITIPNGPNPAVPDGTYTATATLTATDNP